MWQYEVCAQYSRTFRKKLGLMDLYTLVYGGPCDLIPPIKPAKNGLKFKVVLK